MAKKAWNRKIPIPAARSAAQYPAGVSAASCPNYPFCNLAPVSFITRKQQKQKKQKNNNCLNYPFCNLAPVSWFFLYQAVFNYSFHGNQLNEPKMNPQVVPLDFEIWLMSI